MLLLHDVCLSVGVPGFSAFRNAGNPRSVARIGAERGVARDGAVPFFLFFFLFARRCLESIGHALSAIFATITRNPRN